MPPASCTKCTRLLWPRSVHPLFDGRWLSEKFGPYRDASERSEADFD